MLITGSMLEMASTRPSRKALAAAVEVPTPTYSTSVAVSPWRAISICANQCVNESGAETPMR